MASNSGNDKPTKLYRLLSGSITRYEGAEDKSGTRKVVTYEANGEASGNLVQLTEREVQAVGLTRLEEAQSGASHGINQGAGEIAIAAPAHSLTGAPAGGPVEGGEESEEQESADVDTVDESTGTVHVNEVMSTPVTSTNPAVERVLAKKAAGK